MNIKSHNIIYRNNDAFQVLEAISRHNFENPNGTIDEKLLGLYVHHIGGDRVLAKDNKLLICQKIQEAEIVG